MDTKLYEHTKSMTLSILSYIKESYPNILSFTSLRNQIDVEKLENLKYVQEALDQFVDSKVGQDYIKKYQKSDGQPVVEHKEISQIIWRDLLLDFVNRYLKENYLSFDNKKFDTLFNELYSYLDGTANFHHYVPLFNFNSDLEKIEFGNIVIMQVKGEEFKKYLDCQKSNFTSLP